MEHLSGLTEATSEGCRGGMLVVADDDGCRHAVRLAAVESLSDADGMQAATLVRMSAGGSFVVRTSLDDILDSLPEEDSGEPTVLVAELGRMRVLLGTLRLVVARTMQALRDEELLTPRVFRDMLDECLDATAGYGGEGAADPLRNVISEMAVEEVTDLFAGLVPLDG